MHEMSIAVELVRQLEDLAGEHRLERIEVVWLAAGEMRGLVPEAMCSAFQYAAEGTCAEGAVLDLEIVPAVAECRKCGHRFRPAIDSFFCVRCEEADVTLIEGDDILLTSISCQQTDGDGSDED